MTNLTALEALEVATFAERFSVPAEAAVALPAVFGKVVEVSGRPLRSIVAEATYKNSALAEYIKSLAVTVTA